MLHRRRHLALVGDGKIGARPDPAGTIADEQHAEMFRQVIKDPPFAGQVYCKIRARLRREQQVWASPRLA